MPTFAWNNYYHVTGSTYGTWLPGDQRGWRTRAHRKHIEGDYKHPLPQGANTRLHAFATSLLKRSPVVLSANARTLARDTMLEALHHHHTEVRAIAIGATHYHILARFPANNPRAIIGIAKKRSARALSEASLTKPGGVWAVRSRAQPIRDALHLESAQRYVLQHAAEGAAVWTVHETDARTRGGAFNAR